MNLRESDIILALESSCDETAAAVLVDGKIVSNVISSQEIHSKYGGVVPELASRAHQKWIVPVVGKALDQAHIQAKDITAVAFANGPGLLGSLLVTNSFAKGLSLSLGVPLIAVNHLKAHLMAHFIEEPKPEFPFLCLLVSGGHTQIIVAHDALNQEIVGSTIDDAAGEAYDKCAKILGLNYPGGPEIDRLAQEGNPKFIKFATPKVDAPNYSFSGIKTSVLYTLQKKLNEDQYFIKNHIKDIAASIQSTINEYLLDVFFLYLKNHKYLDIALAGGVSANSNLRKCFYDRANNEGKRAFIPKFEYCTDNAAMIAMAAFYLKQAKMYSALDIVPYAKNI